MCIGRALSMMEMKVFVLALVAEFDVGGLSPWRDEVEFASPSFTLRPKHKLAVRLTDL